MPLLSQTQQQDVSQQTRMPVNNSNADEVTVVAGEALTFQYYSAGVLTPDAGQLAGTVVVVKLLNNNILTALGDVVGNNNDSSLVFGPGNPLSNWVPFRYLIAESYQMSTGEEKANAVTEGFLPGDYCIDHESGTIYGVKGSALFAGLTANYLVLQSAVTSSGGGGAVDITAVGGVAVVGGSLPVTFGGNSTALDGTGTLAATGVAQQIIVASTPSKSITIQNDTDNLNDMFVGNVASQSVQLSSGMSYTITIDNANKVYVRGTIGDRFNWGGSN